MVVNRNEFSLVYSMCSKGNISKEYYLNNGGVNDEEFMVVVQLMYAMMGDYHKELTEGMDPLKCWGRFLMEGPREKTLPTKGEGPVCCGGGRIL